MSSEASNSRFLTLITLTTRPMMFLGLSLNACGIVQLDVHLLEWKVMVADDERRGTFSISWPFRTKFNRGYSPFHHQGCLHAHPLHTIINRAKRHYLGEWINFTGVKKVNWTKSRLLQPPRTNCALVARCSSHKYVPLAAVVSITTNRDFINSPQLLSLTHPLSVTSHAHFPQLLQQLSIHNGVC